MGTSPPVHPQWMEQLQQHLQDNDTETQSTGLQQSRREIQENIQQQSHVRLEPSQLQQELDRAHTELREKNAIIQLRDATIQRKDHVIQQKDLEMQLLQAQLQQKNAELQKKETTIQRLQVEVREKEIEFWQVSHRDVEIKQDKVLGGGAWGFVCEGYFHGQRVAIKCVYPNILQQHTCDRVRREISTMARVRHPNLVLFIAAVLEDRSGPKIITEILDTNLRSAYEKKQLGSNKLRILHDVAAAMNYLHSQQEPIIHRDLSAPNVLLEAMAGNVWKAKVSDFGSANLVQPQQHLRDNDAETQSTGL